MPTFTYRARTDVADEATGLLDAEDLKAAAIRLRAQGLYPVAIEPQKESDPSKAQGQTPFQTTTLRLSSTERALLTRQLSQALAAGVSLVKALDLLAHQRHRRISPVAAVLQAQVLQGVPLADAMARTPQVFPPSTVAFVKAGEAGGALEEALRRIAELAERDAELVAKVRAAVTYPAFVLGLGVVTLVVLLTVAVPRLAQMFQDLGAPLPWLTRLVLALSRTVTRVGMVGVPLAAVVGWGVRRRPWIIQLKKGLASGVRRLPGLASVLTEADLARWTRTVGLLVGQGLTMTDALAFSQAVVTDPRHQTAVRRILHDVTEGVPLSQALDRARFGDPFLQMLVTVGEADGDLARNLLQAAQHYTQAVDRAVKTVSALIEPVMIVGVGLVVGTLVFSMLLPVFEMSTVIQ